MSTSQQEPLSQFGAGMLAGTIERYWKARGFAVKVERYELPKPNEGNWGVRSNLVNGLPNGTVFSGILRGVRRRLV